MPRVVSWSREDWTWRIPAVAPDPHMEMRKASEPAAKALTVLESLVAAVQVVTVVDGLVTRPADAARARPMLCALSVGWVGGGRAVELGRTRARPHWDQGCLSAGSAA